MSLQVWLPLNGNLNNNGLLGTLTTATSATYVNNGKTGKALSVGGGYLCQLHRQRRY